MSEINILPPLLTRIGLNEDDIKVYTSTLGLGRVTIGELMVTTGIDPLTLVQTVKNLQELGLLKKISGKTPQYLALLPYLKQYITIERDSLYAIDGIIKSLENDTEKYNEKRKIFGGELDTSSEDHIFDIHIVSGLVKQLTDSVYERFVDQSEIMGDKSQDLLDDSVKNLTTEVKEAQNHSVSIAIRMETFIQELEAFIKQFKHSAEKKGKMNKEQIDETIKNTFQDLLQIITNALDSHTENHKEFYDNLAPELDNVLQDYLADIAEIQNEFLEKYNQSWEESYTSWSEDSEDLIDTMTKEMNELFTEQIKQTQELRRTIEQIDRNINRMSSVLVDAVHLTEDLRKKKGEPILDKLQEVRDGIRTLANDLSEGGLQLIDQHTLALNESRDKIREKFDHFQIDTSTSIKTKKKQIVSKTAEKIDMLPNTLLNKIQNETERYAKSSFESCNNITSELKETVSNKMEETNSYIVDKVQSCYNEHTKIITDFQGEVTTELGKTKDDVEKIGEGFKEKLKKFNELFNNRIEEEKKNINEEINNNKEEMKTFISQTKDEITKQIIEAEEMQTDAIVAQVASVIKDIDDAIMEQLSSLQEKSMAFYQIINSREDDLKQIDKAAANVEIEGYHNVSIVVGEEAIIASLTDIAMRAKRELLIITPDVEESLMNEMSQFTKANRITLVSDFTKGKHQNAIRNLKERFIGLKLKQYDKKDVYCGIKDGFEEAIFTFLTPDTTPVAIRTDNELLLQMFKAAVNRDVLFHTHDYEM